MEINTLTKLAMNKVAIIESLNCTGDIKRRLLDLGIVKGTAIQPILQSPSGDPRAFRVRGSTIALRKEDAQNVIIRTDFL